MNDRQRENFDLDQLLHPAQAFGHPSEVVNDPDLTLNEKRAILASWASDACAVEAAPELRRSPGGPVVRFDEIMDALRTLDAHLPWPQRKCGLYAGVPGSIGFAQEATIGARHLTDRRHSAKKSPEGIHAYDGCGWSIHCRAGRQYRPC